MTYNVHNLLHFLLFHLGMNSNYNINIFWWQTKWIDIEVREERLTLIQSRYWDRLISFYLSKQTLSHGLNLLLISAAHQICLSGHHNNPDTLSGSRAQMILMAEFQNRAVKLSGLKTNTRVCKHWSWFELSTLMQSDWCIL